MPHRKVGSKLLPRGKTQLVLSSASPPHPTRIMSSLVGQQIPNASFAEVPYTPELDDPRACAGRPLKVNTHEAFKGKKVVIVSVPGSFTPTW